MGQDSFTKSLTRQRLCDTRVSVSRKTYTTREAAKAVGITRVTLQRWITAGKIRAPRTRLVDGVGKRLWSEEDISRLRQTKEEIYRKGRGQKPKPKR
jgi:excisionase family DNA binding protein